MNKDIKLCIVDVDGTLTDGGIYYDATGNEWKKFNVKDAAGFWVLNHLGIKTMILTGRECEATSRRAKELRVDYIFQGVRDKLQFIEDFLEKECISYEQIAYIGDDVNDLAIMKKCGYKAGPSNSCQEIKEVADFLSKAQGGSGAVRDIVENSLCTKEQWTHAIQEIYG